MSSTNFHWSYAIVAYVCYTLAFIVNSILLSGIETAVEPSSINVGSIFNILQFIIAAVLCLLAFRVLSKSKISQQEYGIHNVGLAKALSIGAVLGLAFWGISEMAENLDDKLREGGEEMVKSMNLGKNIINDFFILLNIGLFAPVAEEIVFRGGIFNSLLKGLKRYKSIPNWLVLVIAIAVSSYAFISSHGGGGQDAQMYFLLLMSILACISFYMTNSLMAPVFMHAVNNNVVFILIIYSSIGLSSWTAWLLILASLCCILLCIPLTNFFGKLLRGE